MDIAPFTKLLDRLAQSKSAYGSPIDPRDNMCSEGRQEHYYAVGQDALWNIIQSMMSAGISNVARFLDFPSGFGRATRFVRAAFPDTPIDVGDIWREAVTKCAELYNATIVEVEDNFCDISSSKYSVIFCGSLLTHLPEKRAIELLNFFMSRLEVGGIAIVTCSGRKNISWELNHFNEKVFETREELEALKSAYWSGSYAFKNYPGQDGYGRSFTPVSWFHSYVVDRPELSIVRFAERGWDDNQDVVTIKRHA